MKLIWYLYYAIDAVYRWIRIYCPLLWSCIDIFTLMLVDIIRLSPASRVAHGLDKCRRPAKPLEIYEYEGCPFCRKVRENLSVLDIDHIVYPCPRETFAGYGVCLNSRFRPEVKKVGGVAMFPFLVDPNANTRMYQSDDIIKYLWKTYGDKATPRWNYRLAYWPPFLRVSLVLVSLLRPCLDMGILRAPARNPEKILELWGTESSPFVRRVKEALCTLELPYLFHVMPTGSIEKRKAFAKEHDASISAGRKYLGLVKIPFLRDPNTNKELFESSDIVCYLKDQYQTAPIPSESWLDFSTR